MDFDLQVVHSVTEIGQTAWDKLGQGQPFTSYRWYYFGEAVMADCIPIYIILSRRGEAIARGTFWVIRNEPLPIPWPPIRFAMQTLLRRWPLLVCRSPLANASGLILPEAQLRQPALETLVNAAVEEANKHSASFTIFDYMEEEQTHWSDWPRQSTSFAVSDPGMRMEIHWSSFEQYLAQLSQKTRKHYRQYTRQAERLGISITQHEQVMDIEAALALIRGVEKRHRSSPNPWARSTLENAHLAGAAWLAARMNAQLVGCEIILEDNGVQMVTSLGLAKDVPHIYFLLGYADIRHAIEKGARLLRWGSGAYEVKQRLGFQPEPNNHAIFLGVGKVSRLLIRLAARWTGQPISR